MSEFHIAATQNILLYLVKGDMFVNGKEAHGDHMVHFECSCEKLPIKSNKDALLILRHATLHHEPFVAHGPFIMNLGRNNAGL